MKLNYENLKVKSSLIKSATGLSLKEFDYLTPAFEKSSQDYMSKHTFEGKKRINKTKYIQDIFCKPLSMQSALTAE